MFCNRTRREMLWETGAGFTGLALAGLLSGDGFFNQAQASPMSPKKPHFPAKAKSVIFLFMYGGPSQVETFDYKPKLYPLDGKTIEVKTFGRGGHRNKGRVVGPKWKFKPYGKCGKMVSDLFPHVGSCSDDIAFLHSMYADSPIHGSAMLMMNSGRILSGHPCLGSWATYGLGSVNQDLPGFVLMLDKKGGPISGAKNWSSGYMPAAYQGVVVRASGTPIHNLALPPGLSEPAQRRPARPAQGEERGPPRRPGRQQRAGRPHRLLRAGVQDAAARPRGRGRVQGEAGHPGSLRRGPGADGRLRPQVPAGPAIGGARRALHPDLLGRRAQRRQLGRPQRHGAQPRQARRQHRQADRRPAQGSQGARPARQHARGVGRRVRPAADGRNTPRARAATTTPTASRCGWRAAASRAA